MRLLENTSVWLAKGTLERIRRILPPETKLAVWLRLVIMAALRKAEADSKPREGDDEQ